MLDLSWLEISSHWQECRDGKDPGMAIIPEAVLESTRGSTGEYQGGSTGRDYQRIRILESWPEPKHFLLFAFISFCFLSILFISSK
jgi:hypothetical protein